MGLSHTAAAEQRTRMTPATTEAEPEAKPERGHARGRTVIDRSRTDGAELRGVGLVGRGIEGAIVGTRPGRDRNIAREERDNRWLAAEHRARMRISRDRFKRPRD